MRKKCIFSSIFSYFIELQTLNEKCCVIWIICFIYQIERWHFWDNLISFGSVKMNRSTTTQYQNRRFECSILQCLVESNFYFWRSVRVAERLALPTSDHGVAGSNPAGGEILPEPKRHFIAQSLSCSPFDRLEMTEILLKGSKTLTHPSILLLTTLVSHSKHGYIYRYFISLTKSAVGVV